MAISNKYSGGTGAAVQGGLSIDDSRRMYNFGERIAELSPAQSPFLVYLTKVGRKPTDDEIVRIINNLVEEEILYREALNLGLDQDDKIIKRRLAQKKY